MMIRCWPQSWPTTTEDTPAAHVPAAPAVSHLLCLETGRAGEPLVKVAVSAVACRMRRSRAPWSRSLILRLPFEAEAPVPGRRGICSC